MFNLMTYIFWKVDTENVSYLIVDQSFSQLVGEFVDQ